MIMGGTMDFLSLPTVRDAQKFNLREFGSLVPGAVKEVTT